MATITITAADLANADTFLTAYLKDKIPDADFSEGSVVRDFVVKAIAYIFAFLRKEQTTTRSEQSLLTLSQLPADVNVDEAVDALLSNWFLKRKTGNTARITATLHLSKAVDVTLTPAIQFFRTATLVYVPDITLNTVIPASELRPTVNADGSIADYTINVTLAAKTVGTSYNVPPGRFLQVDTFNAFFLFAENLTEGFDGKDIETTSELLTRAPTAISVRNLINERSIDTVLRDTFTTLTRLVTIGYGDPEMLRDTVGDIGQLFTLHTGGYADIYVSLNRTEVVESLVCGALYGRTDNQIITLRDVSGINFVTSTVAVGDILRIVAGIPNVPREYIITAVHPTEIEVHSRNPISMATDEASPPTFVSYSIGNIAPGFNNKVGSVTAELNGSTSRRIQQSGRVMLAGRPHYQIKRVEVTNLDTSITVLSPRVNVNPVLGQYQVVVRVPSNAQSALDVTQIVMDPSYDTLPVKVTYETLVGYSDVQTFVTDRFERVTNANQLVKGLNPVYISVFLTFKPKNTAQASIDPVPIAKAIADYINAFDSENVLDVSAVQTFVRDNYSDVGIFLDGTALRYSLLAPDGQVYTYLTRDAVSIVPDYPSNNARLTNGLDLADSNNSYLSAPIVNADIDPSTSSQNQALFLVATNELKLRLAALGVSDKTIRYFANSADVTITQASF